MECPSYAELVAQWRACAQAGLVQLEEYIVGDPARVLLAARIGAERAEQVLIGAGVHGDEPVTPWALLSVVKDGLFDPRFGYRLWSCMNPTGYELGTRHNHEGIDINRSYSGNVLSVEAQSILAISRQERYRLLIDLHEDFESDGVYLYEPIVPEQPPIGRCILDAVEARGYRLQEFYPDFDLGYPPQDAEEMRVLEHGRVVPNVEKEYAYFASGLPLTMCLLKAGIAHRTITVESPRSYPWQDRMEIHRIAILKAISCL